MSNRYQTKKLLKWRQWTKDEGILVGISSGVAVVAKRLAEKPEYSDKNIVVILPSAAERYLSVHCLLIVW